MHTFQYRLQQKLEETFSIEPNDLSSNLLTLAYSKATSFLKNLPFVVIIPLSLIVAVLVYLLIGRLVVNLATLLQYGF